MSRPAPRLVHVIGVPLDLGGGRRGVDMGPSAVRIAGLAERLSGMGLRVVDRGNLDTPIPETRVPRDPRKKYIREIARVCQRLYLRVRQAHDEGAFPVVIGGDHSLAAGSAGASAEYEVASPVKADLYPTRCVSIASRSPRHNADEGG